MERTPKRRIEKIEAIPFFVLCATCDKTLYEPTSDNIITRAIATAAALDHKRAFSSDHCVYVVDLTKPNAH